MAVVKNLMVRAGADFSGLSKETKKAQQTLSGFQRNIGSTMNKIRITLATIGIGALIKESTSVAMKTEGAMQQIDRTMGQNVAEFQKWVKFQALGYGLAKSEAIQYGASYSNLISGFQKDTAETMNYTKKLLQSSSIIASKTGRTTQDVMERIASGLRGETEAIEDIGIFTQVSMLQSTDAFKKFAGNKSWQQLDFNTQRQIMLLAILEQASKKYGDSLSANTSTAHNQFIAQLKNIQLYLGQAFMPIYQYILPALTSLASKLAYIMNIVAQFSQALFGKGNQQAKAQAKTTEQQAAAVNSVGAAYNAAGKAAKGAVAGFDEVNSLADASGSGVAGATGATDVAAALDGTVPTGPMPLDFETNAPDISAKVQEMSNKVKSIIGDLASFMTRNRDIIVSAITGIGVAFAVFQVASNWTDIIKTIKLAFAGLSAAIGGISVPALLIAAAIGAVVAAFVYFYKTNEGFRGVVDGVLNAIKDAAIYLWQNVLVPMGQFLAGIFIKAWDGITSAAQWLWQNVLVPLGNFLLWMWNNVFVPIGGVLLDILGVAFQTLASIAKSFWENVLIPLGNFFSETFQPTIEALSSAFSALWDNVLKPLSKFLEESLKIAFKSVADTIVVLWHDVLEPIAKFISGGFKNTFDTVFKGIGDVINGLKTSLKGIMEFITGIFTGDWKKAWEGVQAIFKGVFDTFYAIVKTPINLIIEAINSVIRGLNKIHFEIPDWVPGVGGKGFGISIPAIPKLANGGITNGPMYAMIGDNPGGREVVSPLDDLTDMIASAVGSAMLAASQFTNSSNNSPDIVINLEGTPVARIIKPFLDRENQRVGDNIIYNAI